MNASITKKQDVTLSWIKTNKTGLQPVSRPVEQIFGLYPKGFK